MTWRTPGVSVNADDWPLVRVTVEERADVQTFHRLFAHYRVLCEGVTDRSIVWLFDFRHFNPLVGEPLARKAASELFEQHRDMLLAASAAEIRIVDSALTRGVLVAFDWLTGTKWPTTNVEDEAAADRWLKWRLGVSLAELRAGRGVPPNAASGM